VLIHPRNSEPLHGKCGRTLLKLTAAAVVLRQQLYFGLDPGGHLLFQGGTHGHEHGPSSTSAEAANKATYIVASRKLAVRSSLSAGRTEDVAGSADGVD
jgi:hypothetical protein